MWRWRWLWQNRMRSDDDSDARASDPDDLPLQDKPRHRLALEKLGPPPMDPIGNSEWANNASALLAFSFLREDLSKDEIDQMLATAARCMETFERMLKEMPDLDAVCVSVRPTLHHQVVTAALRAGKHVYCEQPLGLNTGEAQAMYELARKNNLRTVLGHQSHYEPATLQSGHSLGRRVRYVP